MMSDDETVEVAELRGAVTALSGRVQSLTGQLGSLNSIQVRQQELDVAAHKAFEQARQALEKANTVESNTIPREELQRRARLRVDRERARRRRNLRQALAIGGVIFVLMAALLLAMLANAHNNEKTKQILRLTRSAAYASCLTRNAQRLAQVHLYEAQIDAERHNHTPGIQEVSAMRIAGFETALRDLPPATDCEVYRR